MNILYINNTMKLGGGVQKCIYQLINHFKIKNDVMIASAGGEFVCELNENNIKHFSIINPEEKSLIAIVKNLIFLKRIVKNYNIDIIHSHHRMTTLYAKIISKITNVKVIHTEHSFNFDKKKIANIVLKNINIISISSGVKENLINEYKLREENITTIYNGIEFIDTDDEVVKELLDAKENGSFIVGAISRLEEVKGIQFLLEAMCSIVEKGFDIKLFIIGDGTLKTEFEEYINRKKLDRYIYLLGRKTNIKAYINFFDIVVQPSINEGLGLAAIESISQGVPVIGSNIDGLNEVIKNNVNGLLFPVGDIDMLSECIIKLYNNITLREKLGESGVIYYNEFFREDIYYNKHKEIYKGVLE